MEEEEKSLEESLKLVEPLIEVLAFFAAMRNYGYLDAIGNALERTTALEALGNALRDFMVTCVQASPEAKKRLEEEDKVKCPEIPSDKLEKAVESFIKISEEFEKNSGLVKFLRAVYVRALALAPKFRITGGES